MTDYDVIVIGCGPAGMMACGELAKRGIKVLGVDKKPQLDVNIRTASGYCFLDQPFNKEWIKATPQGDKTLLEYTDTGFSVTYSGPMEGIHNSHMFSDTGRHWQAKTRVKPFYHTFLPAKCHADRFAWASAQGAQFMPGTSFINCSQTDKSVEVLVRKDGKNKTLTCKKLIAADGLVSRVAKVTGVNANRLNFNMKGPTIEYEMDGVEMPYDRGDAFFFGSKNFGGMAGGVIMVPSPHGPKCYRAETMSVMPASTSTDIIEYFIKKSPFAHWFKNIEILEVSGVIVEFYGPLNVPKLGNILYVGDSAAYGECLYQCAVMCGYKGAECVEMELKGQKGYDEYCEWWADHFEWVRNPKRMADYTKRVLFPRFFTVQELDFLFDLSEKNPIVVDEVEATPYTFTQMVMEQFMAMPEVPEKLKERMQFIIDADMSKVMQVVGQVQKS